jgi:hypothetical protein
MEESKITEQQYIDIYDRIGHESFNHGDDEALRKWGNSEVRIKEIKIAAVKGRLDWYKTGIDCYKTLLEVCGSECSNEDSGLHLQRVSGSTLELGYFKCPNCHNKQSNDETNNNARCNKCDYHLDYIDYESCD